LVVAHFSEPSCTFVAVVCRGCMRVRCSNAAVFSRRNSDRKLSPQSRQCLPHIHSFCQSVISWILLR